MEKGKHQIIMLEELKKELANSDSVRFTVRAVPNAPKSKILEVMDDESVKIAVSAPAEKGKANKELIKFLANEFDVKKSDVSILSGETGRMKIIKIGTC